jgi:isopentenyldiphosphate isomerase
VRWIDWHEFLNSLDQPGTDISPWAKQEVQLLTQSDIFKDWFAREVRASGASASV